jgi:hypothetical protein
VSGQTPEPARQSEDNPGMFGTIATIAKALITALPPTFAMLCVLNIIFLGVVLKFLSDGINGRVAIVGDLLKTCMEHVAK